VHRSGSEGVAEGRSILGWTYHGEKRGTSATQTGFSLAEGHLSSYGHRYLMGLPDRSGSDEFSATRLSLLCPRLAISFFPPRRVPLFFPHHSRLEFQGVWGVAPGSGAAAEVRPQACSSSDRHTMVRSEARALPSFFLWPKAILWPKALVFVGLPEVSRYASFEILEQ